MRRQDRNEATMPPRSKTRSEEVRKGRFAPQGRHVFLPQSGHLRESNDTCADVPLQVAALRWIEWPVSLEYASSRERGAQAH